MKLYVVRNKEGKYFRPVGMGGIGENWQSSLEKAKFYPRIGTAKGQVSFWFKAYPGYGCPDIMEFDLDPAKAIVMDMTAETSRRITKAKKLATEKEREYDRWLNSKPRR